MAQTDLNPAGKRPHPGSASFPELHVNLLPERYLEPKAYADYSDRASGQR